ncbi:HAD family hydrolase [Alkalihalophilus lindianensis]|uniref:HAD family hydrolase n=1 Tax=Alkalihalophilus lindianensis TaxID=1630542 RepID=A0ABU3XCZ8_9BACI|nr:HAD family hydrolase [Alkalihalophilus lindianensis]MDV2685764.1 HAD family hydrolase [Alkalihalophilus lindianensis]
MRLFSPAFFTIHSRERGIEMKLIAIDLDGTLLNGHGKVTNYTRTVVNHLAKEGHKIVLVTGRHQVMTREIASLFPLSKFMVCFNGAAIIERATNQVVVENTYRTCDIDHVIETIKEWELSYLVETKEGFLIEGAYLGLIQQFNTLNLPFSIISELKDIEQTIIKLSIRGVEEELDRLTPLIAQLVPELYVVRSGEESVDIMNKSVSKGRAVRWIGDYYQIDSSDTITFGNYDNDCSMLKYAGIGVAMGNAPTRVKKVADVVAKSNEEDGVATFLEECKWGRESASLQQLIKPNTN